MGELRGSLEGASGSVFDSTGEAAEMLGPESSSGAPILVKPKGEGKATVLSLADGRELVWAGEAGGAETWWDRNHNRYSDSEGNPDIPEIGYDGEAPDVTERFLFYGSLDGAEVYLSQKGGGLYVMDRGLKRIDGSDGVVEVNCG